MSLREIQIREKLQRMLTKKASRIDLESLLADLVDELGGTRQLAKEYVRVYHGAAKSPLVQQKMLLMIQQLVHATTIHNLSKPLDLSVLGEHELDELMATYLDRLAHASQAEEDADPSAGPAGAPADPDAGWSLPGDDEGDPAADGEGGLGG